MSDGSAVRLLRTIEAAWAAHPAARTRLENLAAIMGMNPLRHWVGDLQRYLDGVERDLGLATRQGLPDGLDTVDGALWRLGAGRKSLLALCFLTLGVRTLEPGYIHEGGKVVRAPVKKSFQWELHAELLAARLAELRAQHPVAGQLNDALVALAEHPAMTLRDEVTHSLAPIQGSPELCLFELWGVDGDTLQAPDILGMVWPRRMKEKPGITREQLWPDALKEIADALQLLVRAVDHLSDLIEAVGVSRQPQRLYQDVHTLQVTVYDPRRATN